MNSGMYSALSGNVNMMEKLNVVANNLANVGTVGFKKDRLFFEKVLDSVNGQPQPVEGLSDETIISQVRMFTDYGTGPIKQTGNSLHMAIDGEGFFVVSTPEGNAYTRQGNFRRDEDGRLTTIDGNPVLGRGGAPITIPGGKVEIDAAGNITVDGTNSGSINVVDFPKPYQFRKTGSALFVPEDPAAVPQSVARPSVMQGFIEDSNVNAISEMTQMIECSRSYESCQRVIRSYDEMAGKAIELGRST